MIYQERWVEVLNFPRYEVSNEGRVVNRLTDLILNPSVTRKGYLTVNLSSNTERRAVKIHRLVYGSFNSIDLTGLEINHKDLDKTNNDLSNLELVTSSENTIHALRNGKGSLAQFGLRPVIDITTGTIYESSGAAARAFGVNQSWIAQAIRKPNALVRGHRLEMADI